MFQTLAAKKCPVQYDIMIVCFFSVVSLLSFCTIEWCDNLFFCGNILTKKHFIKKRRKSKRQVVVSVTMFGTNRSLDNPKDLLYTLLFSNTFFSFFIFIWNCKPIFLACFGYCAEKKEVLFIMSSFSATVCLSDRCRHQVHHLCDHVNLTQLAHSGQIYQVWRLWHKGLRLSVSVTLYHKQLDWKLKCLSSTNLNLFAFWCCLIASVLFFGMYLLFFLAILYRHFL